MQEMRAGGLAYRVHRSAKQLTMSDDDNLTQRACPSPTAVAGLLGLPRKRRCIAFRAVTSRRAPTCSVPHRCARPRASTHRRSAQRKVSAHRFITEVKCIDAANSPIGLQSWSAAFWGPN